VRSDGLLRLEEREMLARAQLADLAPCEAWTSQGTNRQIAYSTHGIYRYFGKFPPPLAAHLISRFTEESEWILDPMVGSGTTAVEALLANRHVVARDVSPLSILLTCVKTRALFAPDVLASFERVRSSFDKGPRETLPRPVGLRNPEHWFLPSTIGSLGRIRAAIDQETEGDCKNLLLAAFAATVRRVSRATTQQGRLFLDAATALPNAWPTFSERFASSLEAVRALPVNKKTHVLVQMHNALEFPPPDSPALPKLIIAHPPYFNNYKYSSINSLELAWMGFDHKHVRKQEIRESFKIGKPEHVEQYVHDMTVTLENLTSELANEGILSLMIGDTVLRGHYVPTINMILGNISHLPLRLELVALRVPRYTEASWVASQRRKGDTVGISLNDFVLVFRKTTSTCSQHK